MQSCRVWSDLRFFRPHSLVPPSSPWLPSDGKGGGTPRCKTPRVLKCWPVSMSRVGRGYGCRRGTDLDSSLSVSLWPAGAHRDRSIVRWTRMKRIHILHPSIPPGLQATMELKSRERERGGNQPHWRILISASFIHQERVCRLGKIYTTSLP